jgi:chromosome partitioning protein
MQIDVNKDTQKNRYTGTMIIAVLNQKGGVGKTTVALHLAAGLARPGLRVLLVDADPQGSARDWAAVRQTAPSFTVVGLDRPTLHRSTGPGYRLRPRRD